MLVSAVLWIVRPQVPDQDKAKVNWQLSFDLSSFFSWLAGYLTSPSGVLQEYNWEVVARLVAGRGCKMTANARWCNLRSQI